MCAHRLMVMRPPKPNVLYIKLNLQLYPVDLPPRVGAVAWTVVSRFGLVWFGTGPVPATITAFSQAASLWLHFLRRSDLQLEYAATQTPVGCYVPRWVTLQAGGCTVMRSRRKSQARGRGSCAAPSGECVCKRARAAGISLSVRAQRARR